MTSRDIEQGAAWIKEARDIVVFTGAGVSAESGIATFRDEDGLWAKFSPSQFGTWQGLLDVAISEPHRIAEYLTTLLDPIAAARPNPAHRAIAEIERHRRVTVITQNVDGLHGDAGSSRILEIHGSLLDIVGPMREPIRRLHRSDLARIVTLLREARGESSMHRPMGADPSTGFEISPRDLFSILAPFMTLGTGVFCRPSIVLFGEAMAEPAWSQAVHAAENADLMIVVGTSGMVYPAAFLPSQARAAGARLLAVNKESIDADLMLHGSAAEIVPALVSTAFG